MKRFLCMMMVIVYILTGFAPQAYAEDLTKHVQVTGFDEDIDYSKLIKEAAKDGSTYALQMGYIYEQQRNLKIRTLGLKYEETNYFSTYDTGEKILEAMASSTKNNWWSEDDLDLLSRLVTAEMGCDWMPDWVQQLTATVAINRWKSKKYPNTLYAVIYQPSQYGPVWNGSIYNPATQKVKRNCQAALEKWPSLYPTNIYGQSGSISGSVYKIYYDSILGTTTYFCYG